MRNLTERIFVTRSIGGFSAVTIIGRYASEQDARAYLRSVDPGANDAGLGYLSPSCLRALHRVGVRITCA